MTSPHHLTLLSISHTHTHARARAPTHIGTNEIFQVKTLISHLESSPTHQRCGGDPSPLDPCPLTLSRSSPHLVQVRERIRINGQPVGKELFTKYFWQVYGRLEKTKVGVCTRGGAGRTFLWFLGPAGRHMCEREPPVDARVLVSSLLIQSGARSSQRV